MLPSSERTGSSWPERPRPSGRLFHFGHNSHTLEALSTYALVTGNSEYAEFVNKSYLWARSVGTPLPGFFPEYIDWPESGRYVDCETCCVVDMILIAMTLSQLGQGDYWDDVDRYVRNQFIEMQLLDGSWIDEMAADLSRTPVAEGEDADRVSERLVGSFASWAAANDWTCQRHWGTTYCCVSNGGRALYYVWEKMLAFKDGTLTVNLLFNRASPWADINSYVPYEGRVDVAVKVPCNLKVRIPEWVEPAQVAATVNGQPVAPAFRGRYAVLGRVSAQDLVAVSFPIAERRVDTTIGDLPYRLIVKGNDVVSIDPPGQWYPFYQRAKYRDGRTQWIEQERFVAAVS